MYKFVYSRNIEMTTSPFGQRTDDFIDASDTNLPDANDLVSDQCSDIRRILFMYAETFMTISLFTDFVIIGCVLVPKRRRIRQKKIHKQLSM